MNWIIVLVIIFAGLFILFNVNNKKNAEQYDASPVIPPKEDKRLILYYAPWCPHCKDLLNNVWPKLKEKFGNAIEMIEYDCDKYKCEGIRGYPTIILFKENSQITYNGRRDFDSLSQFIRS